MGRTAQKRLGTLMSWIVANLSTPFTSNQIPMTERQLVGHLSKMGLIKSTPAGYIILNKGYKIARIYD